MLLVFVQVNSEIFYSSTLLNLLAIYVNVESTPTNFPFSEDDVDIFALIYSQFTFTRPLNYFVRLYIVACLLHINGRLCVDLISVSSALEGKKAVEL